MDQRTRLWFEPRATILGTFGNWKRLMLTPLSYTAPMKTGRDIYIVLQCGRVLNTFQIKLSLHDDRIAQCIIVINCAHPWLISPLFVRDFVNIRSYITQPFSQLKDMLWASLYLRHQPYMFKTGFIFTAALRTKDLAVLQISVRS